MPAKKTKPPLPGDQPRSTYLKRVIRVNQAGEFGAKRIYTGQLDVLRKRTDAESRKAVEQIEHMLAQEVEHYDAFSERLREQHIRPTALTPLWDTLGYAMGAGTAMLGTKAAMACTVAVESVIDGHYQEQLDHLGDDQKELKEMIAQFQADEMEHHNTALEEGAEEAPAYPLLSGLIRGITKGAIFLSKRI